MNLSLWIKDSSWIYLHLSWKSHWITYSMYNPCINLQFYLWNCANTIKCLWLILGFYHQMKWNTRQLASLIIIYLDASTCRGVLPLFPGKITWTQTNTHVSHVYVESVKTWCILKIIWYVDRLCAFTTYNWLVVWNMFSTY